MAVFSEIDPDQLDHAGIIGFDAFLWMENIRRTKNNDTFLHTLALLSGGTSRVHPGPVLDEFIALYSRNWPHRSQSAGEQVTAVWWLDGSPKFRLMISPLEAVLRPFCCRNLQGTSRACSGWINLQP